MWWIADKQQPSCHKWARKHAGCGVKSGGRPTVREQTPATEQRKCRKYAPNLEAVAHHGANCPGRLPNAAPATNHESALAFIRKMAAAYNFLFSLSPTLFVTATTTMAPRLSSSKHNQIDTIPIQTRTRYLGHLLFKVMVNALRITYLLPIYKAKKAEGLSVTRRINPSGGLYICRALKQIVSSNKLIAFYEILQLSIMFPTYTKSQAHTSNQILTA